MERFLGNVLWSWVGMAATLAIAILISPYIVRKVGDEGYGVWTLALGLIDYYWLLDFGFRSATLKYSAEYRAGNRPDKINEVMNTALVYAAIPAVAILILSVALPGIVSRFFQISPAYAVTFRRLLAIVGAGWALGVVFNVFGACLEGFQRFDITNRIYAASSLLRAVGCVVVLAAGYRLVAMALVVVCCQTLNYVASYIALRKVFPEGRLSPKLVKWPVMRQMLRYGANTFVAIVGTRTLAQAPPLMIGHYLPSAFIGYFGLPTKLLQYASDLVGRVAMVTGSSASELSAHGDTRAIGRLGVYINRYSLVIFAPLGILFFVYGEQIIRVWISATFAAHSAPLLVSLTLAAGIASAGQYNSASILYGIGKHGRYARSLLVEAAASIAVMIYVVPRYGILGAAWAASILMILNRGVVTAVLLCNALHCNVLEYLGGIFVRPLLTGIPVFGVAWLLERTVLPGNNIRQVLMAAITVGVAYYGLALFTCFQPEHRAALLRVADRQRNRVLRAAAGSGQ